MLNLPTDKDNETAENILIYLDLLRVTDHSDHIQRHTVVADPQDDKDSLIAEVATIVQQHTAALRAEVERLRARVAELGGWENKYNRLREWFSDFELWANEQRQVMSMAYSLTTDPNLAKIIRDGLAIDAPHHLEARRDIVLMDTRELAEPGDDLFPKNEVAQWTKQANDL